MFAGSARFGMAYTMSWVHGLVASVVVTYLLMLGALDGSGAYLAALGPAPWIVLGLHVLGMVAPPKVAEAGGSWGVDAASYLFLAVELGWLLLPM